MQPYYVECKKSCPETSFEVEPASGHELYGYGATTSRLRLATWNEVREEMIAYVDARIAFEKNRNSLWTWHPTLYYEEDETVMQMYQSENLAYSTKIKHIIWSRDYVEPLTGIRHVTGYAYVRPSLDGSHMMDMYLAVQRDYLNYQGQDINEPTYNKR